MKQRKNVGDVYTYGLIAVLNGAVEAMFLAVLLFAPEPNYTAVADVRIVQPAVREAPLEQRAIVGTATRIVVPSVGIDTAVHSGSYDTSSSTWTIDTHSAFHADITVPVNDANGTTLIYGHAGWGIFGELPKTAEGAVAYVYTEEGYRFEYSFESNRQVEPGDVSSLAATGPPKLILQTCSGVFDAYRTLVVFSFNKVVVHE